MKPFRIFIFFTAVLLLLFFIALLMPQQGIGLVGDLRISFFSIPELVQRDTLINDQVVKRLMEASTVTDDPESEVAVPMILQPDPIPVESEKYVDPANTDSLRQSITRLQFSQDALHLLDPFFHTLKGLHTGEVRRARILHYGDSQIENDRMTALIRYRLQRMVGGSGTGLVPAIPLYSGHRAFEQDQKGRWLRYTFFGKRDSTIRHRSYGIMGAFASVPIAGEGEWPSLDYRFNTRRRTGQLNRIRIFLHSYVEDAAMVFQVNDTIVDTILNIGDGFSATDYRHHAAIKDFQVWLDLPEGGRIYGISFESDTGLQIDNIAMRGGSGLIFSKMDRKNQLAMMDHLSPALLLLQFGGNVIPYLNAAFYEQAFKRELRFIKELCPGVPVIVIGPADMSYKEKNDFISYPNVEPIRDALRNATLESGFAFWDMYQAMGGHNSMPSFVHADPPLARPDYIHFSSLGINLVAEMFYNALMLEYNAYLTQNRDR